MVEVLFGLGFLRNIKKSSFLLFEGRVSRLKWSLAAYPELFEVAQQYSYAILIFVKP